MKINLNSKLIAALSVGVLVGAIATIGVSSSSAGPNGIVACANKKTLVVELAKNDKCKSGYSKVTFGVPVAKSAVSPSATPSTSPSPAPSPSSTTIYNYLSVYDSGGTKLGPLTYANSYATWAFIYTGFVVPVVPDNGRILDNGTAGFFSNSSCTGTTYWHLDSSERATRFIASDPLFLNHVPSGTTSRTGTVKAMVQDTSATSLPSTTSEMWELSESGTCRRTTAFTPSSVDWDASILWVAMREIGRVHDFAGPLSIR